MQYSFVFLRPPPTCFEIEHADADPAVYVLVHVTGNQSGLLSRQHLLPGCGSEIMDRLPQFWLGFVLVEEVGNPCFGFHA